MTLLPTLGSRKNVTQVERNTHFSVFYWKLNPLILLFEDFKITNKFEIRMSINKNIFKISNLALFKIIISCAPNMQIEIFTIQLKYKINSLHFIFYQTTQWPKCIVIENFWYTVNLPIILGRLKNKLRLREIGRRVNFY